MRTILWSALLGSGVVLAIMSGLNRFDAAHAQSESLYAGDRGELLTHFAAHEGHLHLLVVVDTQKRVLAAYHVDAVTGEVKLKSVRNFAWDLQMIDYNTGEPLPQDIRSGLGN
jgi:hypothetical protein